MTQLESFVCEGSVAYKTIYSFCISKFEVTYHGVSREIFITITSLLTLNASFLIVGHECLSRGFLLFCLS